MLHSRPCVWGLISFLDSYESQLLPLGDLLRMLLPSPALPPRKVTVSLLYENKSHQQTFCHFFRMSSSGLGTSHTACSLFLGCASLRFPRPAPPPHSERSPHHCPRQSPISFKEGRLHVSLAVSEEPSRAQGPEQEESVRWVRGKSDPHLGKVSGPCS